MPAAPQNQSTMIPPEIDQTLRPKISLHLLSGRDRPGSGDCGLPKAACSAPAFGSAESLAVVDVTPAVGPGLIDSLNQLPGTVRFVVTSGGVKSFRSTTSHRTCSAAGFFQNRPKSVTPTASIVATMALLTIAVVAGTLLTFKAQNVFMNATRSKALRGLFFRRPEFVDQLSQFIPILFGNPFGAQQCRHQGSQLASAVPICQGPQPVLKKIFFADERMKSMGSFAPIPSHTPLGLQPFQQLLHGCDF